MHGKDDGRAFPRVPARRADTGRRAVHERLAEILRRSDTLRLFKALAVHPDTPRRARVVMWLCVGYLASPIDLVPDFLPIVGHVDDAIVVVLALRWIARSAGRDRIVACWPDTPASLSALLTLVGPRRSEPGLARRGANARGTLVVRVSRAFAKARPRSASKPRRGLPATRLRALGRAAGRAWPPPRERSGYPRPEGTPRVRTAPLALGSVA